MKLSSRGPAPAPVKFPGTEKITREDFFARFRLQFRDPAFDPHRAAIEALAEVAWDAEQQGRKAPATHPAGPGFADPTYELADDWTNAKRAIEAAAARQRDPAGRTRVLVVSGSNRNDTTCPGEVSKSRLLAERAKSVLHAEGCEVDVLDLSLVTSQYGRVIHPCKACVSTAMPLCHWPCSCYPNYALGQAQDWMNEIYVRWTAAHAVLFLTPVNWYQAPSALKLMLDRLVCADGGNPDQTTTQGKDARKAKELELKGWDYPKHLAGRVFAVITHGDAAGANEVKNAITQQLSDMGLIPAGLSAGLARYVGDLEPYATSHEALSRDEDFWTEVEQTARGLVRATRAAREGRLGAMAQAEPSPRQK